MGSLLTESEAEKLMKENNNRKDLVSPLIDSFPYVKFHANNESLMFVYLHGSWTCCYIPSRLLWFHYNSFHHVLALD